MQTPRQTNNATAARQMVTSIARSLSTNTRSIISRTTNGNTAVVALNSSMQTTAPQKYGHT